MAEITDAVRRAALNATFGDEKDENVQYVIIRGLSAMGFQMAISASEDVIDAALAAIVPMIEAAAYERGQRDMREKAAAYCEQNAMGMSIRRDGPLNGWRAGAPDLYGTHAGYGYAAAIRALPTDRGDG